MTAVMLAATVKVHSLLRGTAHLHGFALMFVVKSASHTGYLQSLHVNVCTHLHIRSCRAAEWRWGWGWKAAMFLGAVAEEKLRGTWEEEEVDRCWFTNPDLVFCPGSNSLTCLVDVSQLLGGGG